MAFKNGLPTWASLLYLPADEAVPSAEPLGCRPDAVVLDLEDFVPWPRKAAARAAVPGAAAGFARQGIDVLVRINRPLDQAVADLQCAVLPEVKALMLTKLAGPEHTRLLDEFVGELEQRRGLVPGGIGFVGMVESAAGLQAVEAIAGSCARMQALTLGGEDLARECRMRASEATLLQAKQRLVQAAVAAGLQPWGVLSSVADFRDAAGFRAMAERSRDFGFRTATCLRPEQVIALNEVFAPTPQETAQAQALLETANQPGGPPIDSAEIALARWTLAARVRRQHHRIASKPHA